MIGGRTYFAPTSVEGWRAARFSQKQDDSTTTRANLSKWAQLVARASNHLRRAYAAPWSTRDRY